MKPKPPKAGMVTSGPGGRRKNPFDALIKVHRPRVPKLLAGKPPKKPQPAAAPEPFNPQPSKR